MVAISHRYIVVIYFLLNFLKSLLATMRLYVLISLLGVPDRVKRFLAFPKNVRFDSGSSVKIS